MGGYAYDAVDGNTAQCSGAFDGGSVPGGFGESNRRKHFHCDWDYELDEHCKGCENGSKEASWQ